VRLLHLLWPHLPLRLARARAMADPRDPSSGSFLTGPLILGGQPWTNGTVLDASPAAHYLGVRRGMPLGSAHRLAPEAAFLDPDLAADTAAVERALDALAAFSPGVAGSIDPTDPAFGLLEVQLDGLERLWGPESVLVRRLAVATGQILPGLPRAGIAGTRFAATIAASTVEPGFTAESSARAVPARVRAVVPGGEAAFLAPLPAALLTPDPDVRVRLSRFGLRRIDAVARLPRSALVARFGAEGQRIHARANGEEIALFRPRRAPERLVLGLGLEPSIEGLESLRFVLHRLAGALADQLTARGAAAGRVELRLLLDPAFARRGAPTALTVEQRFPEPTAEAEAIERLLLARLEREPPPAAVARLELELAEVAPAVGQQLALFVPQAARAARLGWQLARLALAYGEDRIGRVVLTDPEAALPEARWRWQSIGSGSEADFKPLVPDVTVGRDRIGSSRAGLPATGTAR
jgi:nucleotidyltransferase/DNA polymerase involved in DNA repair